MNSLYGNIDPRDIPIYSINDAARYLWIPSSTIRSWTLGQAYPVKDGSNFFDPLIEIKQRKPYLLSFTNLIEIHILRGIRQHHQIKLNKVREALDFINKKFNIPHPLATQQFSTDGADLFIEYYGELIRASKKTIDRFKQEVNIHLERIEPDEWGFAGKLYPFTRPHEQQSLRVVVIDPRIAFGRLTIAGTGIPTSILKERYSAGDSIDELATDYGCDKLAIEEVIRSELNIAA
jgi:uncharacterized protein (DUF433 family)